MSSHQPVVIASSPRHRRFATSAVAVQAIIINQAEEILLLSSPRRRQGWQLVSGALEANETLLDGTLREVYEELGTSIQVRPLGTVSPLAEPTGISVASSFIANYSQLLVSQLRARLYKSTCHTMPLESTTKS